MAQVDNTQTVARPLWFAARNNRGYIAGSSATQIGIVTNLRATISNPIDSGRLLVLDKVTGFSSLGNPAARIWLNPTVGLPTTTKTVTCLRSKYQNTHKGIIKIDNGIALSGGIDTGIDLVINSGVATYDDPFILDPGETLGVNIATIAGAGTYTLDIRWFEDTI